MLHMPARGAENRTCDGTWGMHKHFLATRFGGKTDMQAMILMKWVVRLEVAHTLTTRNNNGASGTQPRSNAM